jgi:2,3-bisphosphoglycerate-independent phosphoglycerate mutase
MNNPHALLILDGFGISKQREYNAIAHARTPHLHYLMRTYPSTLLHASGTAVGLPDGYPGNSEVGHITVGAGRIIEQVLTQWNRSIEDASFYRNALLLDCFETLKNNNGTVHIMGLLSDSGVHSHTDHLYACLEIASRHSIKSIIVHAFLDGRDSPPQSAKKYLTEFFNKTRLSSVTLGSIHGRWYAMDRDNNWDRTEKSYTVLVQPATICANSWESVIDDYYSKGIYDEFIPPTQLHKDAIFKNGDGIIFYNIRPDRARQLTACFVQSEFSHFPIKPLRLSFFATPVSYSQQLHTTYFFKRPVIRNTLKDILAHHNKTIFSIAETEKYAHITYFFRGENEEPVKTETRVLIPSKNVTTYAECPKMSVLEITDTIIQSLANNPHDFYLINVANPDMVGHSGDFNATVRALECVDIQIKRMYDAIIRMNGTLFITADHGKAECMYDHQLQQPYTAHTINPVPFIAINKTFNKTDIHLQLTQLSDIAPFILSQMNLPIPKEMAYSKKTLKFYTLFVKI